MMIFQKPRHDQHRLLHTLVFSSLLALDGCAEAPPAAPTDHVTSERSTSSGGSTGWRRGSHYSTRAESDDAGGSAEAAPVSEATESPETLIAASDLRYCEGGWPTTKSGTLRPRCDSVTADDGTERIECVDRQGPCVLRPL